ncbi:EH signature domain-containing protein [Vibrio sp. SCSIO 43136]|uniref:EH signature domain-containing protein n=1 Tax=Vibrio sp. SCSIO 43136 TaxID=2819101 RepID=UPI0020756580|nr:EH signature domain-containing protein [Vibrio sp. SCSIO 43136]USD66597.1 transcriptional regulator [Vibrio sp. SCSIO 43136]
MSLRIKSLKVSLPDDPFGQTVKRLSSLSNQLEKWSRLSGTDNPRFTRACNEIKTELRFHRPVEDVLHSRTHVRALALSLNTELGNNVSFTRRLLNKITEVVQKPSSLVIESFYQHFLTEFDRLTDSEATAEWLLEAKMKRGCTTLNDEKILSTGGPQWIAKQAIKNGKDFDHLLSELGLDRYANGQYMMTAKGIYYVEQLESVPVGSDHPLLHEVQKRNVFEAQYDSNTLLGHKILQILIGRSVGTHISEAWMNVVLAIAGDPRVPNSSPKYIKWWSQLDQNMIDTVRGWLSRLDLKLFLEALEDYSYSSGNYELQRMYPARKHFLEGMFDAGLIVNTRLYLSQNAARYLKRNYDAKHLPSFSTVRDGDKSIIYVQMEGAHMIEGSHSCYLWLYQHLDPSICVFNYNITMPSYSALTSGINREMTLKTGSGVEARITHNPSNYSWQRNALTELRKLGVKLTPRDVLSQEDYIDFKQRFGVREWA